MITEQEEEYTLTNTYRNLFIGNYVCYELRLKKSSIFFLIFSKFSQNKFPRGYYDMYDFSRAKQGYKIYIA